jgi:hypothetical protein
MTVIPHLSYSSLFPRSTIKVKGRHFDTTKVIEEESQAVPRNLTEQGFQDAFKKWQMRLERCIRTEGNYFEGGGGGGGGGGQ